MTITAQRRGKQSYTEAKFLNIELKVILTWAKLLQTVMLIARATTKKITQKYIVKGMTRELNLYTKKYLFSTKKAMEKGRIPLKANTKIKENDKNSTVQMI